MSIILDEDFTYSDSSTLPSPWQEDGGSGDVSIDTNRLELEYADTFGSWALTWPEDGTTYQPEDGEVLFKVEFDVFRSQFSIGFRLTDPDYYLADGYLFGGSVRTGTFGVAIARVDSGSTTNLDTDSFTMQPTDTYWIRVRWEGSALKARIWEDGDSEPGTWLLEATDSTYSDGGDVAIQLERSSGDGSAYLDDFTLEDLGASGPTAHTQDLSSGLTLSPTIGRVKDFVRSLSSGLTLSPSIDRLKNYARSLSAGLTLSPTIATQVVITQLIQATVTFASSVSTVTQRYRTIAAALDVIGTLDKSTQRFRTLSQGLTLTPSPSLRRGFHRTISTGLTLTGSIAGQVGNFVTLAVDLVLTPAVSRASTLARTLSQSLTLSPTLIAYLPAPTKRWILRIVGPGQTLETGSTEE